jgi:tagatose-1,6-bisphosphate aldolase
MTLDSIRTSTGKFTIAPFDHRGSLAKLLEVDGENPAGQRVLRDVKSLMMRAFSPLCSGVLVDPIYGFESIEEKAPGCGLILPLEESGYTDKHDQLPKLIPDWGVHAIRENYAVAKLLLFFHPSEALAEQKKKLVMELYSSCQYENIAFMLEPILYFPEQHAAPSNDDATFTLQLAMIQEFRGCCDLLKLEYPGSPLACATITAELDIPWILLSRGMAFDSYVETLKVAMENGCAGFAAGRAVWQEIGQFQLKKGQPDLSAITTFLQTTATERLRTLIALTTHA